MNRTLLLDMKILAEDNTLTKHEILEEGLKYFKTSSKIQKAIDKAEQSLEKARAKLSPSDAKKVEGIVKRMKMAKKEFENVESTYSTGLGKEIAKKKFKLLKTKYADIYKNINMMRNVLAGAGIFVSVGTAAFLLLRFVFPDVAPDLVGIPKEEQMSNKLHKLFNDGPTGVNTTPKGVENFFDKFKTDIFGSISKDIFNDIGDKFKDGVEKLNNKGQ